MNQTYLPPTQKIAFIQAAWHSDIVGQARISFVKDIVASGIAEDKIEIFDVPGSLEIPLLAKRLAQTGDYAIIVATGLVVDGGIYRHDFVAASILNGIMQVQLETEVPILSVVLTPLNFHEHSEHHDYFFKHFTKKGEEAAEACLKTLENMSRFAVLEKAA